MADKYIEQLQITQILKERMSIEEFPGFNKVCIDYIKLKTIISKQEKSWEGALSSIKEVYLICDTKSGRLYVGSATGTDGIWGRWTSYANGKHGGNIGIKDLLKSRPKRYEHFQYSILEVADTHSSDSDIIGRESHWKNVLLSRDFGHNRN